ncbi:MAG: RIP metalloprotease RseP [Patescibacteria group bacterium]|jgi:regulator of sigma E protease
MSLILFLLVLSVLVLIHEAGHYFAARLFGVKADEFGYGFPPRIIGFVKDRGRWKKIGRKDNGTYPGTVWSINWLPLGGFVRIKGEQAGEENGADSFHNKPIWQRIIILAAGVTMNWILAIILFFIVFTAGANTILEDLPPGSIVLDRGVRITQVLVGSPAERAGLMPNDVIVSVDGVVPKTYTEAQHAIIVAGEREIPLEIERGGKTISIHATPTYIKDADRIALGIAIADIGRVRLPVDKAAKAAVVTTYRYSKTILFTFVDIFRDLFARRGVSEDISGPVGIAVITGQIAQQGIIPLLQFAAVLSINLAVINFLPIPALDGGRVLFLAIEKLRRKPMNRTIEAAVHNIAFLFLIGLILLVTIRDVSKFGGVIMDGAKGLVGM